MKVRELQVRQISVPSASVGSDEASVSDHNMLSAAGHLNKSPSMLRLDQIHNERIKGQERMEMRVTLMIGGVWAIRKETLQIYDQ